MSIENKKIEDFFAFLDLDTLEKREHFRNLGAIGDLSKNLSFAELKSADTENIRSDNITDEEQDAGLE